MPSQRKTIALRLGRRRNEFGDLTRDLSAMAARSQALMRAQQQRVNGILHDLKSPLARLSVALGLARQQTGLDAQEALNRIELEAETLSQMLQQLLGLARVEAGMELPAAQEIDLLGLVKDVTADANFEAIHANRTVQLMPCGPCTIHAVKDTLRCAIENVARNAIVHTAEGTAVEISVTRPQSGKAPLAIVSVRDHGQGVPPSLLTHIFRPFFRVENSPSRKLGGAGLGLAIAERAVRLHGGTITAANHPNGGLVVEIRLPAKARSETNIAFGAAATTALNRRAAID
jgi:two-component system sensor histidine kinase CpxA